jgi:Domain of unknown function (DUF1707)
MSSELERASDREREEAVSVLREDLVAGRLTLEEFSARVGAAYSAPLRGDLARLRDDLPNAPAAASRRRPLRLSAVVFGHLVRRGRLRLRRHSFALSAFADLDLDLREASIESECVVLHLWVLTGNADIYVPEGVDVDAGGLILFGRRRDWGRDTVLQPTPRLTVRAHGVFGTVDVWRVPPGVRGTYSEVIEQIRAQQHESEPSSGAASNA